MRDYAEQRRKRDELVRRAELLAAGKPATAADDALIQQVLANAETSQANSEMLAVQGARIDEIFKTMINVAAIMGVDTTEPAPERPRLWLAGGTDVEDQAG